MTTTTDAPIRSRSIASTAFAAFSYLAFLAVFAYTVAFVAGTAVPRTVDGGGPRSGTGTAVAIDCALLAMFALQHSVMARPAFKRRWTRIVPPHLERSSYVLASSAVLGLICWQWRPLPHVVWHVHSEAARAAIWLLCALGWVIVLAMTFAIDHLDLVGLRQVKRHVQGMAPATPAFRIPLPYRLVRHPMMTGFFIALLAAPTMTEGHLLFALMSCGYIVVGVLFEERDLATTLPQYRDYASDTPRFFPRLVRRTRAVERSLSP